MADLATHILAVHDCVHEAQSEARQANAEVYKTLREQGHENRNSAQITQIQIGRLDTRLHNTEDRLSAISDTVGAPTNPTSAGAGAIKFMNLKWWQAVLALGGALAGATGGYKILAAVVVAFNKAMLAG